MEKEAKRELQEAKDAFLSWVVKEGGEDMKYMNIGSTAQIQQLLFAPCKFLTAISFLVVGKKGKGVLEREKQFAVENTTGYIEPGKKKPLKNRLITIKGLGIPPIRFLWLSYIIK